MAANSAPYEEYRHRLPALREERRSGGLMVAYGVTLALVIGSAVLAFGFVGSDERGATARVAPTNLPTPSTPLPTKSAGGLQLPAAPSTQSASATPPMTGGSLKLPPRPASQSRPPQTSSTPPSMAPSSVAMPARPAPVQPASTPSTTAVPVAPKPPTSAGLAASPRPLIQALPDPVSPERQAAIAWKPLAANGLPAPPPEKPLPPSSFRALPPVGTTEMTEVTADGLRLPKISTVGWMPWIAYARRYAPDGPPARVGLMMINVGATSR